MSLFDDFRALTGELFDAFELPVATITRTVDAPQTNADRAAGRKGASTTTTLTGRGKLGELEFKFADGSTHDGSTALLTIAPRKGDKLTIGTKSFEVIDFKGNNPDGGATAFTYVAALK
ncbi:MULTISPECIES: hypothetical protein [Sphingomonas]|uniref:hypothetical protein n=1 Tax=Sphingomonas TaxID=13687 RepID=UPI000F7F9D45|nr:hypothetical protein [Sphingomonas sp. ABOLF]RSV14638.1 hypothetical protein CA235_11200 [Sphingomonas sp. ABOLF]GLK19240.1 hypothetical protein GCM10017606_00660 [Microbacterium terregens]